MSMNIGSTPEEQKRIDTLIDFMGDYLTSDIVWRLKQMGFFIVPASIHHHGKYEGALFDHSYEVTKALVNFTEKLGLEWQNERSPYIVGMFHDLCKTDNYVKTCDEAWEYNNAVLLPGHGEKSVMMAMGLLGTLTDEEILCIRWHMGAFDDKGNWNSCSTMHKIHDKPFVLEDFSHEHLFDWTEETADTSRHYDAVKWLETTIEQLNHARHLYINTKNKDYWWLMIQLLPTSYNQKRTITMTYENLLNMLEYRRGHKLDEWRQFCEWVNTLPNAWLLPKGLRE